LFHKAINIDGIQRITSIKNPNLSNEIFVTSIGTLRREADELKNKNEKNEIKKSNYRKTSLTFQEQNR